MGVFERGGEESVKENDGGCAGRVVDCKSKVFLGGRMVGHGAEVVNVCSAVLQVGV